jgi:hypothetical protein
VPCAQRHLFLRLTEKRRSPFTIAAARSVGTAHKFVYSGYCFYPGDQDRNQVYFWGDDILGL